MGKQHDSGQKPVKEGSGYQKQPEFKKPAEGADASYKERSEINKPKPGEFPEIPHEYNDEPLP